MPDRIESLKKQLVAAREANERAKEKDRVYWEFVTGSAEYKDYTVVKEEFETAAEAMLVADKALRDAALEEFKEDRNISAGVTIKMHHRIRYKLEDVISWAEDKAKHLFKFDVKAFEKAPPEGAPFEKYDDPYVSVATDNADFQLKEES